MKFFVVFFAICAAATFAAPHEDSSNPEYIPVVIVPVPEEGSTTSTSADGLSPPSNNGPVWGEGPSTSTSADGLSHPSTNGPVWGEEGTTSTSADGLSPPSNNGPVWGEGSTTSTSADGLSPPSNNGPVWGEGPTTSTSADGLSPPSTNEPVWGEEGATSTSADGLLPSTTGPDSGDSSTSGPSPSTPASIPNSVDQIVAFQDLFIVSGHKYVLDIFLEECVYARNSDTKACFIIKAFAERIVINTLHELRKVLVQRA